MKWNNLNETQPMATESGNWDGLKSEPLLVADKNGIFHVAVMYKGFLDGSDFQDFYSLNDFLIENVTHWVYIPSLY